MPEMNHECDLCFSFLVDACSFLLERAGTVGLFRKPGSLPRIKKLRVRYISIICQQEQYSFIRRFLSCRLSSLDGTSC